MWEAFAKFDEPPKRLVVLGGGPSWLWLAQSFARLGSTVTQVERSARASGREDEEVSAMTQESLIQDGIDMLTSHSAVRCEKEGDVKRSNC